jgi:hypothetical protein
MSSSINKRGSGNANIVRNKFNYKETKQQIKCMHCRECKQELCYNRDITSAMREHLKRKHVHVNLAEGEARMR